MERLKAFLNGLSPPAQAEFARRSGTTIGYLRKCLSTRQKIGERICINIERESDRAVRCEDIRADVDWACLRNSPVVRALGAPSGMAESSIPKPVSNDRRSDAATAALYTNTLSDRRLPREVAERPLAKTDRRQLSLPFNRRRPGRREGD
jgi:DNA-binding transcriptional regulator YdaS (Cro superfamily)